MRIKMCEDSTYLVSPTGSVNNSNPDETKEKSTTVCTTRVGDVLGRFHENCLSEQTVSRVQMYVAIVLGLGLMAEPGITATLDFILPFAEVHLCFGENEKTWLALAGGSLVWGILGDYLGRRKTVISSLLLTVLFSVVATVMPTYGTFMMAWFCVALGVSGIFPLCFTYLSEICTRNTRCRFLSLLFCFWLKGFEVAYGRARFFLPKKAEDILQDKQEHWSSWHWFLLSSLMLPVGSLFLSFWTFESPRHLLEISKEMEALDIYEYMQSVNSSGIKHDEEKELPELKVHKKRLVISEGGIFRQCFTSLHELMRRISTPSHFRTTAILVVLHFIHGFAFTGISSFSNSLEKSVKDKEFIEARTYVEHGYFADMAFERSIENTAYKFTTFKNVTFGRISMNHVSFTSCILKDSAFVNVKTSKTYFENATIDNCRFVDTDLTDRNFLDSKMRNNTFLSLIPECPVELDDNIFLSDRYNTTQDWSSCSIMFVIFQSYLIEMQYRPALIKLLTYFVAFANVAMFLLNKVTIVQVVEAFVKTLMTTAYCLITVVVIESYPCYIRCTAHGLMRCFYHLGTLCAINICESFVGMGSLLTIILLFVAAVFSGRIHDNFTALS